MEPKTNIVTWLIGDERYDVDLFDIDGIEWRDAKRVTGMSQGRIVYDAIDAKDFEAIAAILWIWRRRTEPGLEYEKVLGGLKWSVTEAKGMDAAKDDDGSTASPPG